MKKEHAPYIFATIMAIAMGFFMSFFFTWMNTSFSAGFFIRWMKAFVIGGFVALPISLLIAPVAQKIVDRLVGNKG
jgi:hypothetical protein